jgi:hypothetical protein
MRKSHREGERLILSMGFKIIESGRGKHHYWLLRTPDGKQFKQPIPHSTAEGRFWDNFRSQLRKHLNDPDHTVNPRSHEPAGVGCAGNAPTDGVRLDAFKRKGDSK